MKHFIWSEDTFLKETEMFHLLIGQRLVDAEERATDSDHKKEILEHLAGK